MNQDPQLAFMNAFHALILTLLEVDPLQLEEARNTLLNGIPGRELVKRSTTTVTDLLNIANHAANHGGSALVILRKNVLVYVLEQDPRRDAMIQCFDALEKSLPLSPPDTPQGKISCSSSDTDVPFTNRDDELKLILANRSPAHHALDGPIGYGKTKLLEELETRLGPEGQGYMCARVSAKDNQTMVELVTALCRNLDVDSVVGTDRNVRKIGVRFGQEILKTKFPHVPDSSEHEGIVLLFDDIGPQFLKVSQELLEVFIPAVEETLRTNIFFSTKSNAFRAVLCGRYLAQFVTSLVPKLPWELSVTTLKPFDYKVVWNTARKVLTKHENVEQTSAHILHLTGGHPYCMAQVLNFYKEHPCKPETFIQLYSEQIWEDIVGPQVIQIRKSIPNRLCPICDRLSVFRIFNSKILGQLMESFAFHYEKDEFSLQDELAGTHLYDPTPERYMKDAIVRRMLVLQFRRSEEASKFPDFCDKAHKMCLSLLEKEKGLQNRDLWAVECLFQALQGHADSIENVDQRLALRKSFLKAVVPKVLEAWMLASSKLEQESDIVDSRVQKQELGALVREMNRDRNWDFRFSVNYYLRGDFYSEKPFEQLIGTVLAWRKREVSDAKSGS